MPIDDSRQSVEEIWRLEKGEPVDITNDEIRRLARKLERETLAAYWAAWALMPVFVALFVRSLLHLRKSMLIAGVGLAFTTLLLIAGPIVRNRPARISTAQRCLNFVRATLEAKRRGESWICRALLLMIPAVICCWAGRPEPRRRRFLRSLWAPVCAGMRFGMKEGVCAVNSTPSEKSKAAPLVTGSILVTSGSLRRRLSEPSLT